MHIYFIGQAEVRIAELAKQATLNGYKVTIATPHKHEPLSLTDITLLRFPSFDPTIPGGYLYTAFSCIAALFIRPNTIAVHSLSAAILIRPLLAFMPNTCAVWTIDSVPKIFRFLFHIITSGFDQVCVSTRTAQYRLLTQYNMKTTYIPDGYTPPELADIRVSTVGLTKEKYVVVLTQDKKEVQRIAKAFVSAKSRKKLIVFGTGRTSARVTYIHTPLTSRLAASIIRQAAFVIGADSTYSPLLLQAMDAGRHVIATTDPLHEELLGVTAKYYKNIDNKQLIELIRDASKGFLLNKSAIVRAKHHFTWNTVGLEYEKAYKHSRAVLVPFDSIIPKRGLSLSAR